MKKLIVFTIFAMMMSFVPMVNAGVISDFTMSVTEIPTSTATEITFTWTASAEYSAGDTIVINFSDSDGNALSADPIACSSPTTDIDGDTTADGALTFGTTFATYTFTQATTQASAGKNMSVCVQLPGTAMTQMGVYTVSVYDTGSPAVGDFTSMLFNVEDGNDVLIQGDVVPYLHLALSEYVCDLGVMTSSHVASCEYDVVFGSNAANGVMVQIASDGDFDNDNADIITNIANSGTFVAGTEAYGIQSITAGANTAKEGNFATDATPVPASATNFLSQDGPYADESSTVSHAAAITALTPNGHYTQVVTYTATGSF